MGFEIKSKIDRNDDTKSSARTRMGNLQRLDLSEIRGAAAAVPPTARSSSPRERRRCRNVAGGIRGRRLDWQVGGGGDRGGLRVGRVRRGPGGPVVYQGGRDV